MNKEAKPLLVSGKYVIYDRFGLKNPRKSVKYNHISYWNSNKLEYLTVPEFFI